MNTEVQIYHKSDESIVVYRSEDNMVQLEVKVTGDTVWLTQQQMATLFGVQRQAITKHIKNIYDSNELQQMATSSILEQVQKEGNRNVLRTITIYNLDVIISVGFRVNTVRGIKFRQWANKTLKDYMLQGYAISNRFERLEQRVSQTERQIEYFVHTALPPKEGIFADGQIYDAFQFVQGLIKSAKQNILLIDNYIDESVLTMMSEKNESVQVDIYTKDLTPAFQLAETRFNSQYSGLTLHQTNTIHDRFLILDNKTLYLIGASLKDAGKRLFAFTELDASMIAELKSKL